MSELISAQTTAANSADFTVTTSTGISCYGMEANESVGVIEKKMSDTNYYPFGPTVTGTNPDVTIVKPGTYRFRKFATESTVGVDKDE